MFLKWFSFYQICPNEIFSYHFLNTTDKSFSKNKLMIINLSDKFCRGIYFDDYEDDKIVLTQGVTSRLSVEQTGSQRSFTSKNSRKIFTYTIRQRGFVPGSLLAADRVGLVGPRLWEAPTLRRTVVHDPTKQQDINSLFK